MQNPFELLEARLSNIENLLLDLKHQPTSVENSSKNSEKPLSISEVAEFLNLSNSTIYGKVSRGELPYMKRGKRLYFSQAELENYLKDGRKLTLYEIASEADSYCKLKKG